VNIPPLDLKRQYQTIASEIEASVLQVMASGGYIGGSRVQEFEQQFANYIGTSECVSCASGTDALYLALRALDIGPGDEVITTPFTFMATAETISMVGATPVFVDIEADTFNIDVSQVAAAITEKTRAIMPVHLFGQPVDMTELMAVAHQHGLAAIEDVAQAAGSEWAGKKTGSMGHIGCFSFFPTKNLGAFGDGGAVTTNDPEIAAKIRVLKEHGASKRYYHETIGINSRLDALQAAILQIKLPYLDTWNDRRRAVAADYQQHLADLPGIITPQETPGSRAVWNQYTIRVKSPTGNREDEGRGLVAKPLQEENQQNRRDRLRQQLQDQGISSMVYYPFPLHRQPVYQHLGYDPGQLPIAEHICQQVLSLPMFPELSSLEIEAVVNALKNSLS
jgi:dTDP-4-amino-4,6-dideoxygalactose transaminase